MCLCKYKVLKTVSGLSYLATIHFHPSPSISLLSVLILPSFYPSTPPLCSVFYVPRFIINRKENDVCSRETYRYLCQSIMIQTNVWIHIKKIFLEEKPVTKETDLDCKSAVSQERFPWESDSSWAVSRQTGTGEGSSSNCRNAKCHSTLEATCAFS
jgi:hypothetical protein